MGASALFWSGMPYLDQGRSPPKTLGRPIWRVKTLCVPSCVPNSPVRGRATVSLCGNGSPELERRPRSRTEPPQQAERGAFTTDFAGSLRPASMARCTGSSGGFASHRRDPLLGTYREGRAADHVGAGVCRRSGLRLPETDRDCYNFLYEIEGTRGQAAPTDKRRLWLPPSSLRQHCESIAAQRARRDFGLDPLGAPKGCLPAISDSTLDPGEPDPFQNEVLVGPGLIHSRP